MQSTVNHLQNEKKTKSNVIKITYESHEQVISNGSKTKSRKIQVNINYQFLIEKSIEFLSQPSVGRKIKSLSKDMCNNDLNFCLSKHEKNNEYIHIYIYASTKPKPVTICLKFIGFINATLHIH